MEIVFALGILFPGGQVLARLIEARFVEIQIPCR